MLGFVNFVNQLQIDRESPRSVKLRSSDCFSYVLLIFLSVGVDDVLEERVGQLPRGVAQALAHLLAVEPGHKDDVINRLHSCQTKKARMKSKHLIPF